MKKDKRVDTYITHAEPFAHPILKHLRKLVHKACPKGVETMKWHSPFYEYEGMLCFMAAFKQHVGFGFWRPKRLKLDTKSDGMGVFGKITSLKDLPSDAAITRLIKQAMRLNEAGNR